MLRSATVVLLICVYYGRMLRAMPEYRDAIPNGRNIPDPCNPGSIWDAVGHLAADHGGDDFFNAFGLDFNEKGLKWNPEICKADSDGDGRSNGLELGDPLCVWCPGATPAFSVNITHPGICEPINSALCTGANSKNSLFAFDSTNCQSFSATSTSCNSTKTAWTPSTVPGAGM